MTDQPEEAEKKEKINNINNKYTTVAAQVGHKTRIAEKLQQEIAKHKIEMDALDAQVAQLNSISTPAESASA